MSCLLAAYLCSWFCVCPITLQGFVSVREREWTLETGLEILKRPIRKFRYFHIRNRNSVTLPLRIYISFWSIADTIFFFNSSNQKLDVPPVLIQAYRRTAVMHIEISELEVPFQARNLMIRIVWGREKEIEEVVLRIRVFIHLQLWAMPLNLLVKIPPLIEETGCRYEGGGGKGKYIHV